MLIDSTVADLRTTANGGRVENANGYDIIFTSDRFGASQLAHEIERYVATTGEIVFWVRLESLAATTSIYMWYGNSEQKLHSLFEYARQQAPCVLFFDEVDALGASRADLRQSSGKMLINQFLSELDGVDSSNDGVLILAVPVALLFA